MYEQARTGYNVVMLGHSMFANRPVYITWQPRDTAGEQDCPGCDLAPLIHDKHAAGMSELPQGSTVSLWAFDRFAQATAKEHNRHANSHG